MIEIEAFVHQTNSLLVVLVPIQNLNLID